MINYDGLRGGLPDWSQDGIHVVTDIRMDWRDRLRVLFGAVVTVHTVTFCENLPGKTDSAAQIDIHSGKPVKALGVVTLHPAQPVSGAVVDEAKKQ